jgi:hypothetical protein
MHEYVDTYMITQLAEGIKKAQQAEKKKQMEKHLSPRLADVFTREGYMPLQLLIAHYLGWLDGLSTTNENMSVLLAIIFNKEGTENIRKNLSSIQDLKSEQNLEDLRDFFEILKFGDAQNKVENDIRLLNRHL